MSDQLVRTLRFFASLHDPDNGGPYMGAAADKAVLAMGEAADEIVRLRARVTELEAATAEQEAYVTSRTDSWAAAASAWVRSMALADQLADVLTKFKHWDSLTLNPDGTGSTVGDAPWARRLIDTALATHEAARKETP